MNINRLRELAGQLMDELDSHVVSKSDWMNEGGFPKYKEIGPGKTKYLLVAPVNPQWRPSTSQQMLGQQTSFVADPGTPPGNRSPAGFPLNAETGKIPLDDATFDNDSKVMEYLGSTNPAEREEAIDVWKNHGHELGDPGPWTGSEDPATLGGDDWAWYINQPLVQERRHRIFSSWPRMQHEGRDVTPGDLANVDTSTYVERGGRLAKYL